MEERDGNDDDAIVAYNDCLSRSNDHKEALIALARLYQNNGNNDQAAAYCNRILKLDAQDERATFMYANLMLLKEQ